MAKSRQIWFQAVSESAAGRRGFFASRKARQTAAARGGDASDDEPDAEAGRFAVGGENGQDFESVRAEISQPRVGAEHRTAKQDGLAKSGNYRRDCEARREVIDRADEDQEADEELPEWV